MNDIKSMLRSRTVWAAVIGFATVLADAIGFNPGFEQGEAVDAVMKLVEALSFLSAIVFRVKATARIA